MSSSPAVSIAIFASGSGTNAENIVLYFQDNPYIKVSAIISNNSEAGVIQKAIKYNIPVKVVSNKSLNSENDFISLTMDFRIDFIILAGFLLKIPDWMIRRYNERIMNIHPALLPKYGGKGMYGIHVHNAVKNAGESITGITVHLVNENYDEGEILLQAYCKIKSEMTVEEIAWNVHKLEYAYYPACIKYYISQKFDLSFSIS